MRHFFKCLGFGILLIIIWLLVKLIYFIFTYFGIYNSYINLAEFNYKYVFVLYGLFVFGWWIYDLIRGYALLDFQSLRLRSYLLNAVDDSNKTISVITERQANKALRRVKVRRDWKKPHNIEVFIWVPNNQKVSEIIFDRVISEKEYGKNNVVGWLETQRGIFGIGLTNRHWSLIRENARYIKIIGFKN